MRVLHIVLGLQIGGLERFVLDLVSASEKAVVSTVLCLADPETDPQIDGSLRIIRWNKASGLQPRLALQIAKLVRQEKIDIIHTHNPGPHLYGALAGVISRRPVVHSKHGRNYPGNKRKVWLNRIASALSRRIVAVSADARAVCMEIEKTPDHKVITILNGIDTNRYHPAAEKKAGLRESWAIPSGTLLIGIVARLSSEKNHALLLEACALLKQRRLTFELAIIGDGPLRPELERMSRDLDLSSFVHFLGARADVALLLPMLDVFALSSTTEGISLTLLEAMSCGLPVVATAVGGNPEVVIDGETGFVVPLDATAMANTLQQFATDEDNTNLGLRMGRAGRERVLAKFSLSRAAAEYDSLYREVLEEASA